MSNINEKSNRNKLIYDERKSGIEVTELAEKYGLSLPRIHRICIKEENKELKLENAMLKAELDMLKEKNNEK